MIGAQTPRILVVPEGVDHPRWPEIVRFLEDAEIVLDPWQLEILRVSFMVIPGTETEGAPFGLWAAFVLGVCCPRQNGKNEILEARELVAGMLLEEPLQVHSAHLADTCGEAFLRMEERIDGSDFLRQQLRQVRRANGKEAVVFRNGCRIRYRTRTRGGGRGFGAGVVKLDEAMYLPEESETAIFYVLSAQPNPQIWYTGSAVDQATMEDGIVFTRVRDRAMKRGGDRLAWFEWSLDLETPDLAPQEFVPELVAEANPAFGKRITAEYARAEFDALGDSRGYAVERLGVGDWPDVDKDAGPIAISTWNELYDSSSEIVRGLCLSFDVSPERSGAIGAAGWNAEAAFHVEIADMREGTNWIPRRIAELAVKHRPLQIVCDERGPGASLIHAVSEALLDVGYELEPMNAAKNAQACGLLVDAVNDGTLRHLGDARLVSAIRGAGTRPLSDAWSWARKSSTVDISSLVAITLALWSASGAPDTSRELVIY